MLLSQLAEMPCMRGLNHPPKDSPVKFVPNIADLDGF